MISKHCLTTREALLQTIGVMRGARKTLMDEAHHQKYLGCHYKHYAKMARERNQRVLFYLRALREA